MKLSQVFIVVVFLGVSMVWGDATCNKGQWTYYAAGHKLYALIEHLDTQPNQAAACAALAPGASLAAPLNADETAFILNLASSSSGKTACHFSYKSSAKDFPSYWLAGQRATCSNNFAWQLSGGKTEEITYKNWMAGEPNCSAGNDFCLHVDVNFAWNDIGCEQKVCAVCELRLC